MIVQITEEFIGERIDLAISKILSNFSRSQIQKFIKAGVISHNGVPINNFAKKVLGPCEIRIHEEKFCGDDDYNIVPESLPLDIIFEDENIIIIDKPQGIVCHPSPGHRAGTIVNALIYKFEQLQKVGEKRRPGIVHRLDKDTSGLLLVAKTNAAHKAFSELFANNKGKTIKRKYTCFVFGIPKEKTGRIETFLIRHPKLRQQYIASNKSGKRAITLYQTEKSMYFSSSHAISKITCELLTGRTHQIRVHMKYIGNHLIGDKVYGKLKTEKTYPELIKNFERQALHSSTLSFVHPITGEYCHFESKLPEDLALLDNLWIPC